MTVAMLLQGGENVPFVNLTELLFCILFLFHDQCHVAYLFMKLVFLSNKHECIILNALFYLHLHYLPIKEICKMYQCLRLKLVHAPFVLYCSQAIFIFMYCTLKPIMFNVICTHRNDKTLAFQTSDRTFDFSQRS